MEVTFTGGFLPVKFGYHEFTSFDLRTSTENGNAGDQCISFNDDDLDIDYNSLFREGALSKAASNSNTATIFNMLSIVWLVLVKIYLLKNPFNKVYNRPKGSLQIWSIPGQLLCEIAFVLQFAGLTNILDEKKSICDKNRYDPDDFGGIMKYGENNSTGYLAWENFDECNFSDKGEMAVLAIVFLAIASTMLIIFSCIEFTEGNDEDDDMTAEERRAARMAERQSLNPQPSEPHSEGEEEEFFDDSAVDGDVTLSEPQDNINPNDDDVSFATEIDRVIPEEEDDDISHMPEDAVEEVFLPDVRKKKGFKRFQ